MSVSQSTNSAVYAPIAPAVVCFLDFARTHTGDWNQIATDWNANHAATNGCTGCKVYPPGSAPMGTPCVHGTIVDCTRKGPHVL